MTVQQLIDTLQKIGMPNAEVCVRVTKCLSPATGEPVTRVYNGFNWEDGKLMLCTDSPLIRDKGAGPLGIGGVK